MQHNTSDQTFRSSMAVGSWDGTPLFSDISQAIQIIQQSMNRGGDGDGDEDEDECDS